ncbi:MAG: DNA internalization-related competence protein ComEC/Rec2 [Deltaproteobacteria bacterium]|nr:DNA internalization-related competence protein ComEC/Rec2 [Candidatus Zymogenaceae bacterium]
MKGIQVRYPLPILTVGLIGGILAGYRIEVPITILLLLSGALLVMIVVVRAPRLFFIASSLAFFIIGMLLITPHIHPERGAGCLAAFSSSESLPVCGRVAEPPDVTDGLIRVVLSDVSIREDETWTPYEGRLRLTILGDHAELSAGDTVFYHERIRHPRNFNNERGFDYERYLIKQGIYVTSFVGPDDPLLVIPGGAFGPAAAVENIRSGIRTAISCAVPGEEAGVLRALSLGERGSIPPDLLDAYYKTGMGHILAISGLHVGIVFVVFFTLAFFILVRIPGFALARSAHVWAAALALVPVIFYTVISGPRLTAVRASVMVTALVLSIATGRERDTLNTLGLAATAILVVFPVSLFDASFQFSFVAVLAIILIFPLLTDPVRRRIFERKGVSPPLWHRLLYRGYEFASVSIAALIGVIPLSAFYFFRATVLSIPLNFIVVPLLGFGAVPLLLLSTVLVFVHPASAGFVLQIAAWLVNRADAVVRAAIERVPDIPLIPPPTLLELVLIYGIIICVIWWAGRRETRRTALVLGAVLLMLLAGDLGYRAHERFHPSTLTATFISVGQGEATLLELPDGVTMLIDAGGFSGGTFDVGEYVVGPYLLHRRVRTVDYLMLTHPEIDHVGGAEYILSHFRVKCLVTTDRVMINETTAPLMDLAAKRNIPVVALSAESPTVSINDVIIETIAPPPDVAADTTDNNTSLVLRISYGDFELLMTGDIEAGGEVTILESPISLEADVLKVPHHGAGDACSRSLISVVHPRAAVISCGYENRFSMPAHDVLERLVEAGASVFRTDLDGAVILKTDGESMTITTMTGRKETWDSLR